MSATKTKTRTRVKHLERELQMTREVLQSTIEEMRASKEELRLLKEEVLAASNQFKEQVQERGETHLDNFLSNTNIATLIDTTMYRKVAEELREAKSRFLAHVDHELRQPLQALTFLSSALARKVRDTDLLEYVNKQHAALSSINHLLHQLLDFCRIDAGITRPELTAFPVTELLDKLKSEFKAQADSHGLALRVVPCSAMIRSDLKLLYRILQNLVSNAINLTEAGGILVGCRRHGERLRIEVWYTSPRISGKPLDVRVEDFPRLDNPARQISQGYAGVGLFIAWDLAHRMQHDLDVCSMSDRGSLYTVEVPRVNVVDSK